MLGRAVLQLNSVHVTVTTVSRLMVEGFVSHTELKLFVLISPDRSFQSRIEQEVLAFMKKYGGHVSTGVHRTKTFASEQSYRFSFYVLNTTTEAMVFMKCFFSHISETKIIFTHSCKVALI